MTDVSFFHVEPTLSPPSELISAGRKKIEHNEKIAQELETEIRRIAMDRSAIEESQTKIILCVDFSVLHSALNFFPERNKRDAFWASVALDVSAFDLILLPGTLFELINFEQRRHARSQTYGGPLGHAFVSAFKASRFDDNEIYSSYESIFKHAIEAIAPTQDDYLLSLLRTRFKPLRRANLIAPDHEIFMKAMHFLAEGSRAERIINNRVDAYNLSLVSALNRLSQTTNEHYVIISNAASMRRLQDRFLSNVLSRTSGYRHKHELAMVWQPRYAAIHQLIHTAGKDYVGARVLAWRIVERLVTYRSALIGLLTTQKTRQITEKAWDTGDDAFIRMISSIESLQDTLNEARQKQVARVKDSRSFKGVSDPRTTFDLIRAELKKFLDHYGYKSVPRQFTDKKIVLKIEPTSESETAGDGISRYSLVDARVGEWIAGLYSGAGYSGLYFKTDASLEQFVAVVNFIYDRVLALVGMGDIPYDAKEQTGVLIGANIGDSVSRMDLGSLWPLDTIEFCRKAECQPTDIVFIRINTEWFDVSFEMHPGNGARFSGIATHLAIFRELETFLCELSSIVSLSGEIESLLKGLFVHRAVESVALRNR
ncbi:hypothetical protein [Rhodoplanes sp. SY1]|uniref:hypothetical protein n=1 Tax=Rhodoplanes sp. SY1 TaxID=3166646 RepID=UPI0038B5A982